ncbi:membrane protein containing DUF125, transmembrane, partial [mine drainage metagenome]
EMRELPDIEREEVRQIFRDWGFAGPELEEMVRKVEAKPKAMLDLMMAFELHLAPVSAEQPLQSGLLVLGATVVGSIIPLIPFLVSPATLHADAIASVVVSGAMLFAVGWYGARLTIGDVWASGLRMLVIGLAAGLGGFAIGLLANARVF